MKTVIDAREGAKWYNCCWLAHIPQWVACYGFAVRRLFDPMLLIAALELGFALLLIAGAEHADEAREAMARLHNIVLGPMVTVVGLYAVFKQRRPGMRLVDGKYVRIGTVYGMPSGDSMLAAVLCCVMFGRAPRTAVFLWLSVCASRLLVGFHDFTQVTAGSAFGFAYMALRRAVGERAFTVLNWASAGLVPLLAFLDKELAEVQKYDYYNIQLWVIVDISYLCFDIIYCAPEGLRMFAGLSEGWRLTVAFACSWCWMIAYQYCYRNGISISKRILKIDN